MEIIKITKENASNASHIYALSWKTAYQNIIPQSYLDSLSLERWTPLLQNSPYANFLLQENEEFMATGAISPSRDATRKDWGKLLLFMFCPVNFLRAMGKNFLPI